MVKTLDIDLKFAVNGLEAVEYVDLFQPDLVFMDISMPEMDGKEATQRIRQSQSDDTHLPIIALTAHAMPGDDVEIMRAGMDHYMTKPLRKAAIHEQIYAHQPQGTVPLSSPVDALLTSA
ncbi:UNVERIFIED_CONTAM: hypothetical protein GTU68_018741 [Idotea baltica]|nr:hypothetical protein [Idotea baltica]